MIHEADIERIGRKHQLDGLEREPAIYHLYRFEDKAEENFKAFRNIDRTIGYWVAGFVLVGCAAVIWMGTR